MNIYILELKKLIFNFANENKGNKGNVENKLNVDSKGKVNSNNFTISSNNNNTLNNSSKAKINNSANKDKDSLIEDKINEINKNLCNLTTIQILSLSTNTGNTKSHSVSSKTSKNSHNNKIKVSEFDTSSNLSSKINQKREYSSNNCSRPKTSNSVMIKENSMKIMKVMKTVKTINSIDLKDNLNKNTKIKQKSKPIIKTKKDNSISQSKEIKETITTKEAKEKIINKSLITDTGLVFNRNNSKDIEMPSFLKVVQPKKIKSNKLVSSFSNNLTKANMVDTLTP